MADMTLGKIKALRAAITSSEWQCCENNWGYDVQVSETEREICAMIDDKADGEFIAAAPAAIDWLIAQLEATKGGE